METLSNKRITDFDEFKYMERDVKEFIRELKKDCKNISEGETMSFDDIELLIDNSAGDELI